MVRTLNDKTDPFQDQVYGSSYGQVYINKATEYNDGNESIYEISVTSSNGYDGNLTVTVVIRQDGIVFSAFYTELHETPGKGMLCDEPSFKKQFFGKNVAAFELGGAGDARIDSVSGATITSKATVNAVNAALDFFYHVIMEG